MHLGEREEHNSPPDVRVHVGLLQALDAVGDLMLACATRRLVACFASERPGHALTHTLLTRAMRSSAYPCDACRCAPVHVPQHQT